mgnify:CR=1 FL=1
MIMDNVRLNLTENDKLANIATNLNGKSFNMNEHNIDKIIEELEKLADESYKAYCIAFNSDDRAEYDAYTNAIEIVKGGGVDA